MVSGPFPSPCCLCGQAAGKNAPSRPEDVAGRRFTPRSHFLLLHRPVFTSFLPGGGMGVDGPLCGPHEASSLFQEHRRRAC